MPLETFLFTYTCVEGLGLGFEFIGLLPHFQERQPCLGHRLLPVLGVCATDGVLPGRVEVERNPKPLNQAINHIVSVLLLVEVSLNNFG